MPGVGLQAVLGVVGSLPQGDKVPQTFPEVSKERRKVVHAAGQALPLVAFTSIYYCRIFPDIRAQHGNYVTLLASRTLPVVVWNVYCNWYFLHFCPF